MNKTYKTLFLEFVVIVIGVLTAFGVEELATSINENKQQRIYLKSVKAELTENKVHLSNLINGNIRQASTTDTLLHYLDNKILTDSTELFKSFLVYGYMIFNLGAYEALKNSRVYHKLDNIELTTKLNNLIAQVESTLEFQGKIETLQMKLFVEENNDAIDPISRIVLSNSVYSLKYKNNIKQIQGYRLVITDEFKLIRDKIDGIIELIETEIQ